MPDFFATVSKVIGFPKVIATASMSVSGDEAYLDGLGGVDWFFSRPTQSYLRSSTAGSYNRADGFDYVEATVKPAGVDRIFFDADTVGSVDKFFGTPTDARMEFANGAQSKGVGFDKVKAWATKGDGDEAFFDGSANDDTFIANGSGAGGDGYAYVSDGSTYYNYVTGFDAATADVSVAAGAGYDLGWFNGTDGNDAYHGYETYAEIDFSNSWTAKIIGADKTRTHANLDDGTGLGDVAYLYGSTGNDTFNARKDDAYLRGTGFNNQATRFDAVYGDVISGDDKAYMFDWTADDTFWSRNGTAKLIDTALSLFHNEVTGFESLSDKIVIVGTAGGTNTLDVVFPPAAEGIDYLLQNNGGF